MADLSCVYALTTPAGTIRFNDGDLHTLDDLYWIADINGLDGSTIRAQVDNAPQNHGGHVHTFWKGPRHITFEGAIVIQSVPLGGNCLQERNVLEENLRIALESILQVNGTLSWTPTGLSSRSLTVRHDVQLDYSQQADYAIMGFVFGLVSASADWA